MNVKISGICGCQDFAKLHKTDTGDFTVFVYPEKTRHYSHLDRNNRPDSLQGIAGGFVYTRKP